MAILWCGGEDIDFPNGGATVSVSTSAGLFRAGFARCGIKSGTSGVYLKSNPFAGGAVTSSWLSFYVAYNSSGNTNLLFCGLIDSATASSGLWVGISATASRLGLFKFDGTTKTLLATSPVDTFTASAVIGARIDLQLVSFGATATVNVFINGSLVITYTGDVTVSGVTNVGAVGLHGVGGNDCRISEFIVATEDTRTLSLLTMVATGDGTTNAWTGAATDENETSINDATALYTDTAGLNEQYNLTDPPAGVFSVKEITRVARVSHTVGSTATKAAIGFNIGGSVQAGTAQSAPAGSWGTISQSYTQNPATTANWLLSELTALQSNAQSGS